VATELTAAPARRPAGILAGCLAILLCAGTLAAGAVPAGAASPQPVVTRAPAANVHDLPFGRATLSRTLVVAGAPGQRLSVAVALTRSRPAGETLVARLYRPALPSTSADPGGRPYLAAATRSVSLDRARAGSTRRLDFGSVNPPAGSYRLDVLTRAASGRTTLVRRVPVTVSGQLRLPEPDGAFAREVGTRALAPQSSDHSVNNQPGGQAETYVAQEPDNQARALAGVNPSNPSDPVDEPDAFISDQFMRPGTIVARQLPRATKVPSAEGGGTVNVNICCDPIVAADRLGNLWYGHLTLGSTGRIIVNRVAPRTTTLQAKNTGLPRRTTCATCQDKPMLTIDNWPGSPKYGTLYAVWNENRPDGAQNTVLTRCETRPGGVPKASRCDDPNKWSKPVKVTDTGGSYIYAAVAAAPNGDVYVVWQDYAAPQFGGNAIEGDRCRAAEDCSTRAAWEGESTIEDLDAMDDDGDAVADALPFFCRIEPAPGGRTGPQPYVDVGNDGRVYVAFSDLRPNGATRCTDPDPNPVTDRTFDSYIARGATPNALPPRNTSKVRLSDDGALARNHHFFPSLTVDQATDEVQSNLYSTKADATQRKTHQYVVRSTDDGASYSPMAQITSEQSDFSGDANGFNYGDYQGADSAEGLLLPVWTDGRLSNPDRPDMYTSTAPAATGTLAISPATSALPAGTEDQPYTQTLTASGGTGPYTFSLVQGSLPDGLALSSSGPSTAQLSGTPTESGRFSFRVRVVDSAGTPAQGTRAYTLTIAPTIALSPATLPGATKNVFYEQQLTATGGTPSYRFTVTSGSLPPGLNLKGNGIIRGTPTSRGTFTFEITAIDQQGFTASRNYSITVT